MVSERQRKTVRLSFALTPEENERLEAYAEYGSWSVAWVIRRALKEYLDRCEAAGKIKVSA